MDFKDENLQFFFRYEFNEGVSQADKDLTLAILDRLNGYFVDTGSYPKVNMQLVFTRTENGWFAYETFPDAAAYCKHAENTMACPFIGELFATQAHWKEVEGRLCGLSNELAKAPMLAEYYPT
jgi:hypothetical protein